MKKFSLIATLLLAVLLLQKCKKDTVTAVVTSSQTLFATINDSTWDAATINAVLTYNSATKTKVFSCIATGDNKQINMSVTQAGASNTDGFPLATYNADAAGTNTFAYLTATNNVFVQRGVVAPGSGTITVTAIDSVKKLITGTFSLTAKQNNYDTNGNIASVTIYGVNLGAFNSMPYTFKSN